VGRGRLPAMKEESPAFRRGECQAQAGSCFTYRGGVFKYDITSEYRKLIKQKCRQDKRARKESRMNSQSNKGLDRLGIILTDNIDLEWLQNIEPNFHGNRVKFDVNISLNKVAVGMDVHSNTLPEMGSIDQLLGGFIYTKTGMLEYESTLNIPTNEQLGSHGDTMREIVDADTIAAINNVLLSWVVL
ncbi:MAG: hypothetical protein RR204_07335, partial [Raoultibacter sp.]